MKRIGMGIVALLLMVGCATQQERAEQRAKMRQTVEAAIVSRQLRIDIKSMNAMRYGSKMVTPDFYLELRGDTLRSYLPYLGQVRRATIGGPSVGLNFEAPILQYAESKPKANKTRIELDVRSEEDAYHYFIEVYDTGEALIRVRSQYRDPISFDGYLTPVPER